jgi:hypothetical protein
VHSREIQRERQPTNRDSGHHRGQLQIIEDNMGREVEADSPGYCMMAMSGGIPATKVTTFTRRENG